MIKDRQSNRSYRIYNLLFWAIFWPCVRGSINACKLLDLTASQVQLCKSCHALPELIDFGIQTGTRLCHHKYEFHRWNCDTFAESSSKRIQTMPIGSKEAAIRTAYIAASVARSVIGKCISSKILDTCSNTNVTLDENLHQRIKRCRKLSRSVENFLNGAIISNHRRLMEEHNYRAAIHVTRRAIKRRCFNIGEETCWAQIPTDEKLQRLVTNLAKKAVYAIRSAKDPRTGLETKLLIKENNSSWRLPKINELVYIDPSPSYCIKNKSLGSVGVAGRKCHLYATANQVSCEEMCCNYGFSIIASKQTVKCNCEFNLTNYQEKCNDCTHMEYISRCRKTLRKNTSRLPVP